MLLIATVSHPALAIPFRVVRDSDDIVSNGETYYATPFDFVAEPRGEDTASGVASFVLPNVDQWLLDMLEASDIAPTVTLEVVMSNAPDTVEMALPDMLVSGVEYDANRITGTIPKPQFMSEPFPYQSFIPSVTPGYFA